MTGSKKMTRSEVVAATQGPPPGGDFVWDGVTEDERPLAGDEMRSGIAAATRGRGRPAGSGMKEQVALRLDRDVLAAFRASGPGWQTRMNAALREWLKTHSPV